MIYRGFKIEGGWPIGTDMKVLDNDTTVKTFPFGTTDSVIMDWIDAEKRRRAKEHRK